MTQLIADVLKRDEEERLRREAAGVRGIFAPFYDDATRSVYDAADAQAGQVAAMRGNPFGEYAAPTARYHVP